jgi:hypothetical protein
VVSTVPLLALCIFVTAYAQLCMFESPINKILNVFLHTQTSTNGFLYPLQRLHAALTCLCGRDRQSD